jgi:hypothetical protein
MTPPRWTGPGPPATSRRARQAPITFTKAGTYDYTSKSEPWVHAQITVEEAPAPAPAAATPPPK